MGVSVREKPKGSGIYWVFITHQGKRKSKKIGNDEKLALGVAEKIKARLVLGELNVEKINSSAPTFKRCAELWLSLPHDWKESTRENYQDNLRIHIYPVFGKMPIDGISRKEIKAFFSELYAKGLNLNTLKVIRAPLSGVFSFAVESEHIESNPLRDLKLNYKKKKFEIDPLTEAESLLLLDQAKIFQNGIYYPAILCALRTGMRIGEIQALKWNDIDFDKRQIEVRRSYRQYRMTDTKNHKHRRVDMTLHLAETLMAHRTSQKREALKKGKPFSEFVFTGIRDEMLNRISFQNALNRCAEKAQLRYIRTHSLRHSYATIRLMKGHNVGDVSYQLGHSSIKITYDVYAHWIPGQFKSEVDELDQAHPNAPYTQPKNDTIKNL
jgi:integrase